MRPPPLPHQVDILQQVLNQIAEAPGGGCVAVFDLDATLYDNRSRTLNILLEYADEVRDEFPHVADAIASLGVEQVDYLLTDTLRNCGIMAGEVVRDVTTFWRDRFFSDDYCAHDVPLIGAVDYVRACYDAGATIVYLTGRDVPAMLLGTVASLRDHGFPIGVAGVELILKPDANMSDEAFKRGALPTLARVGEVAAFFDNEPANCNLALDLFPHAAVVWLETQCVPGAPEPIGGVEKIMDFRLV